MHTVEVPHRAEPGAEATQRTGPSGPAVPRRSRSPWVFALIVVLAVALLVAVTVSAYPLGRATPSSSTPSAVAPSLAGPHPQTANPLTVLPIGQASWGCFDPRSYLDGIVLCPSDLQGRWIYDGGLSASQVGSPSCLNFAAGPALAWVNLDNGLTHVHEQLSQQPSSALARAAVDGLASRGGAALCPNLTALDGSKVASLALASPSGGSRVAAWSVPAAGRTWDLVFVALDSWVIRIDVTLIGASSAAPPSGLVQQVVEQSVRRYQTGLATQTGQTQ